MMILLLLIVLGVILWYFGILNGRRGVGRVFLSVPDGSKAMDIAKNRYASGEIEKDEFETLRRDLAG